ncbi:flagellin [Cryobacterium sp. TMT2-18-3]|uniref:flagellin N-terminal helical domain-containing protein n=1 Tax=unclassified Cryobacterium TaxID=2649013 RepID=UPI00106CD3F9|nr:MULTISPECIES: flagellin [unclassified Cryobacterium]TFC30970.1 flagellin [Cryobacterium sp. TMT2-18-2]TFC34411.1 flagellin [Cryobacterium sp. TMT2-42-4]TFC63373.1 flagellin [Cryobacterium sp. TMT2-18-3]
MGMQINTNLAANNTYRNLAATQNDMSKSLEKLSSGLRINRAADDAAGLAISEGLKSQVGGLTVASRNAQDGISVIQTAEGSLNEVQSILQRVRDLAVQAGNDSNNADSRGAIKTEVDALTKELTRISEGTNFNGTQLLDGTKPSLSFQVGANSGASSQISVSLSGANVKMIAASIGSTNRGTSFADAADATAAATAANAAQTFTVTNGDGSTTGVTTAAFTGIGGATVKDVNTNLAAALNADSKFKGSMVASVDSNGALNVKSLTGGSVAASTLGANSVGPAISSGLDFSSASSAAAAITLIDTQIKTVSTARASLGADQNRFESVIKNLAVSKENLTAAGSRIRDTDMAEEMVKYTRSSILSQAGTAMLAQANQSNQGVLSLLR